jgi:hypothetical protein
VQNAGFEIVLSGAWARGTLQINKMRTEEPGSKMYPMSKEDTVELIMFRDFL